MKIDDFFNILKTIKSAKSVQGKSYINIYVDEKRIHYQRESGSSEYILIRELFNAYRHCDYINTKILRKYITGYKFSPSLAILIKGGFYDNSGNRKSN